MAPGTPRTRALAAALRKARTAANMGVREVARKLEMSHTTISQWETGKRVPSIEDVSAMLAAIGVTGLRRKHILDLARNTAELNWLAAGIPGDSQGEAGVLECERTATDITNWAPMGIPGAFQTEDYATAIHGADDKLLPKEIDARVQRRVDRRRMLTDDRDGLPPVEYTALIGEWGLRQRIGGAAVQAGQLRQVLELAELPTVTVRVVPVGESWHPGLAGPFVLYSFAAAPPIVHLEHHRSSAFLYEEPDVTEYKIAANQVRRAALSDEESAERIAEVIREMEG